jgi:hypothetical protein
MAEAAGTETVGLWPRRMALREPVRMRRAVLRLSHGEKVRIAGSEGGGVEVAEVAVASAAPGERATRRAASVAAEAAPRSVAARAAGGVEAVEARRMALQTTVSRAEAATARVLGASGGDLAAAVGRTGGVDAGVGRSAPPIGAVGGVVRERRRAVRMGDARAEQRARVEAVR